MWGKLTMTKFTDAERMELPKGEAFRRRGATRLRVPLTRAMRWQS
jgi:hypothetical protein